MVHAKVKIRQAGMPFREPERGERLEAVLGAIYATYAEGWPDPAGTNGRRRNLAGEGIWLAWLVASLLPAARRDRQGEYVSLAEQDPVAWNAALIDEAESLLLRAPAIGRPGRYRPEAAVQSADAALVAITRSPVLAINQAVAIAETQGAETSLSALNDAAVDARLADYQHFWAARAG
jgi:RNA polymerase sigma-70 factor, ECF subfamily